MDGENNGKPYEQMDDLGGFTTPIFGSTPIYIIYMYIYILCIYILCIYIYYICIVYIYI